MRKIRTDPAGIWAEYEEGRRYKEAIGLYEDVETYEAFYTGDQWRGLNAPDLPKVQLNFLQRVISMSISKVVSEDFSVTFTPFKQDEESRMTASLLSLETERAAEALDLRRVHQENVRDAAVDGDTCNYFWFDADAPGGGSIRCETLENTGVFFGDPTDRRVQEQPYILLSLRKPVEAVREEAEKYFPRENSVFITPDEDEYRSEPGEEDKLCTVVIKLFKRNGTVYAVKTAHRSLVRSCWDTGLSLYPLAWMSWEKVRHRCHGRSAVAGLLPNQIALNKAYSGIIKQVMTSGFPTLFYNSRFLDGWDGRPGRAVAVEGNADPSSAASYLSPPGVDPGITNVMDNLVSMTKEFMGTADATLGTVKPENASAIIALQNADMMPMELRRREFFSFVEQEVRVLTDMMRACYGVRPVQTEAGETLCDFSVLRETPMQMKVDIGAATYWSETMQAETLNALFNAPFIADPALFGLYIEVMPEKYLPGKEKMRAFNEERLRALHEKGAAAQKEEETEEEEAWKN